MYRKFNGTGEKIKKSDLQNNILWMNGITTKEQYKALTDDDFPYTMENSKRFGEMIDDIREKDLFVVIVGDYDVDGVVATTAMNKFLDYVGIRHDWMIPNRFTDGYGLKTPIVERAIEAGAQVIITVDNGIKSKEAITFAKSKGLTVIVTDHHQPDEPNFPHDADLIVNPHVGNKHLVFPEICGGMVVTALVHNYMTFREEQNKTLLRELFEITALSTVSDVMPLKWSNRTIVQFLVNSIRKEKVLNYGIRALLKASKLKRETFTALDIGYLIGPMVNAPGRLETADIGVELLMAPNPKAADTIAQRCSELNEERKEVTQALMEQVKLDEKDNVHVVYIEGANEGIIGIISGRITEKTGKPSFVFTDAHGGTAKGSGRSPENYNLIKGATAVLEAFPHLVLGYGGHAGAMGLSLVSPEAVDEFRDLMNDNYNSGFREEKIIHYIEVDVTKQNLKDIYKEVEELEPYGEGFKPPVFKAQGNIEHLRYVGKKKKIHSSFAIVKSKEGEKKEYLNFMLFKERIGYEGLYDIFFTINEEIFRDKISYKGFVKDAVPLEKK
jgi:single-stranded-DNA-specific exonuclease